MGNFILLTERWWWNEKKNNNIKRRQQNKIMFTYLCCVSHSTEKKNKTKKKVYYQKMFVKRVIFKVLHMYTYTYVRTYTSMWRALKENSYPVVCLLIYFFFISFFPVITERRTYIECDGWRGTIWTYIGIFFCCYFVLRNNKRLKENCKRCSSYVYNVSDQSKKKINRYFIEIKELFIICRVIK